MLLRSFSARSLSLERGVSSKSQTGGFVCGCCCCGGTGLLKEVPAGAIALARMPPGLRAAGLGAMGDEAATWTTGREAGEEMSGAGERSIIWVGCVMYWLP